MAHSPISPASQSEPRRISHRVRPYWRTLVPVIFLCATFAHATPIKPDLKKLLAQPAPRKQEYIPARAGWDGPELRMTNTEIGYVPEASNRAARASLLAAAVPDWRAALAIILVILLLRRLRKASPDEAPASHHQPTADIPRAA